MALPVRNAARGAIYNTKGGGFTQCPYCNSRMTEKSEIKKITWTCTKDKAHVLTYYR